ncbi:hypothetical protein [Terrisporobacter glycolicus]|uniref:Peptidase propeptide and YPEB domain protein n=1 Tax=Terrisporobacter glycolicus ATCC 14880 = DSM 1288 TaxID=1121315 RepID=A0ABZ2EYV0_9FIRM|nr:hypothetical protein [Terrisporobacter glycolicus]
MKSKLFLLALLISFAIIFIVNNIEYSYKENELYNQNDISNYSEKKDESNNLINRNKAIKIATYILKDILNINIENHQININLYRGGAYNNGYNWNVSFYKNDISGSYGVIINSNTGEINEITVSQVINYEDGISNLSNKETISLINKLTSALGFDLNNYNLSSKNIIDYNIKGTQTVYKVCTFINKTDSNDKFEITIDCKGKIITKYARNSNKEV